MPKLNRFWRGLLRFVAALVVISVASDLKDAVQDLYRRHGPGAPREVGWFPTCTRHSGIHLECKVTAGDPALAMGISMVVFDRRFTPAALFMPFDRRDGMPMPQAVIDNVSSLPALSSDRLIQISLTSDMTSGHALHFDHWDEGQQRYEPMTISLRGFHDAYCAAEAALLQHGFNGDAGYRKLHRAACGDTWLQDGAEARLSAGPPP